MVYEVTYDIFIILFTIPPKAGLFYFNGMCPTSDLTGTSQRGNVLKDTYQDFHRLIN